jgi:hypothetical protein
MRRQRTLQLPANLSVLSEKENIVIRESLNQNTDYAISEEAADGQRTPLEVSFAR